MEVTDILEIDKKRAKIYIDGLYRFVLYKGEIRKYKIAKGNSISEEIYMDLTEKVIKKRAILRAMNLLTKKTYTESQLRTKLKDGYYEEEYINAAIEYVKSYGYINDENYLDDYIEYHKDSMSKIVMKQKLLAKGIDKNLIEQKLEQDSDEIQSLERKQIQQLFLKKYKGVCPIELSDRNKMYQFFMRKGYSLSLVKSVLGDDSLLDDIYRL